MLLATNMASTMSVSGFLGQPPTHPARKQPARRSLFTSIDGLASTVSRPDPLGRPDPNLPLMTHRRVRQEAGKE